jgi:hypothetical protein
VADHLQKGKTSKKDKELVTLEKHLKEVKDRVGHGRWLPWLKAEFGWTGQSALNFIRVYELSQSKSKTVLDLNLPLRTIYLLAAPSTPQAAKDEVIERAANGDELSHDTVKGIVDKSKTTTSENAKPTKPPKPEVQPEVPPEPALQVTDGTMGNDTDPAQSAAAFAAIHAAKSEPAERVAITPPALSAITDKPNLLQAWDQASEEDREILCNLALDPLFFRQATGTDLLNQIVNFGRKNLAEDILVSLAVHILNNGCYRLAERFLDALGVDAMLKSMSAQFKAALHARLLGPASTEPAAAQVQVEPAAPARPLDHTDCGGVPAFVKREAAK